MVGRPVRAPDARRLGGGRSSTGPPTPSTATSDHTQGQTTLDRDRAGRPHPRRQLGDGHRHDGAGQLGRSWRRRTPTPTSRRRCTRRRSAPDGSFSVADPARRRHLRAQHRGHRARHGATARVARTVVFDQPPGTLVFAADDPDGDDNGPGNYAYPTARRLPRRRLRPRALRRSTTPARPWSSSVRTRDLTPTFGSPLGAQLVDVYVHVPGAARPRRPRRSRSATLLDRRRAAPGAGSSRCRASASASSTPAGATLGTVGIRGQRDLALHHVRVPKAAPRARRRRAGASPSCSPARTASARPGARLPADAAGLPVRRVRDRQQRPALHVRPRTGAQGDRRPDPDRRRAERRARLHADYPNPVTIAPVVVP